MHNRGVDRQLGTLAEQVEVITRRIATLGLTRAADDLRKVSSELRRLRTAQAGKTAGADELARRSDEVLTASPRSDT